MSIAKHIRLTLHQLLLRPKILILNSTTSGPIIMISRHQTPEALQLLAAVCPKQKLLVSVLVMHIPAPSHLHQAQHNGKILLLQLLQLPCRQRVLQDFKASMSTRHQAPQGFKASRPTRQHAPQGFKVSMPTRHQAFQGLKASRSIRHHVPQGFKASMSTRH
jgi:hypothetical protein